MKLLQLFFAFFRIGLFSIGGGYAIIPMIRDQVVLSNHWLSMREFTDIITISQMTPGPLAVNTSTFVGMRVAGVSGAPVSYTHLDVYKRQGLSYDPDNTYSAPYFWGTVGIVYNKNNVAKADLEKMCIRDRHKHDTCF